MKAPGDLAIPVRSHTLSGLRIKTAHQVIWSNLPTTIYCVPELTLNPEANHRQDIFHRFFDMKILYISIYYGYVPRNLLIALREAQVKRKSP